MQVVYYGEKLLDFEWNSFPFDYQEFLASLYCERLRHYFRLVEVDERLDSFFHGISHTERVAFYAAAMAWREGLSIELTDVVIVAGLLHDVGRAGDMYEANHGAASVSILKDGGYKEMLSSFQGDALKILYAIIELHCPQGMNMSVVKKTLGLFDDPIRCQSLLLILKDADVLDRVRLSNLPEKLYLYSSAAKQLEPFSKEVFSKYWQQNEDSVYYHVTKANRAPSILSKGLLLDYHNCGDEVCIYFAATPEECMRQVPFVYSLNFLSMRVKRLAELAKLSGKNETVNCSADFAVIAVDLSGLEEKIVRRISPVNDLPGSGRGGLYEFCLAEDVPPDRIIGAEYTQVNFNVPTQYADAVNEQIEIIMGC